MHVEVYSDALKLLSRATTDEAVIVVVVLPGLLLLPHVTEGIDDDTGNDARVYQVDDQEV